MAEIVYSLLTFIACMMCFMVVLILSSGFAAPPPETKTFKVSGNPACANRRAVAARERVKTVECTCAHCIHPTELQAMGYLHPGGIDPTQSQLQMDGGTSRDGALQQDLSLSHLKRLTGSGLFSFLSWFGGGFRVGRGAKTGLKLQRQMFLLEGDFLPSSRAVMTSASGTGIKTLGAGCPVVVRDGPQWSPSSLDDDQSWVQQRRVVAFASMYCPHKFLQTEGEG